MFGALGSLTEALVGMPQRWQGPTDIVDALRGDETRPGLADVLIPESEAVAMMRAAIPLGVAPGRLQKIEINGRPMRRLKAWDPEHLRYDWSSDTWRIYTNKGDEYRAVEDGEWVLFCPYGESFPWKRAPWKAITLAFTLSRDAWFQRSRYAQVIAPTRVGSVSEGSTEEQRLLFASYLANAKFDSWLVLRPGESYDVKGVSGGDRTTEVFADIIEWARRTAITTIKGETVTTDGSSGFDKGSVQERMSSAKMAFYARAWARFESEIFSWASYDLTGRHARVMRTYVTATPADALEKIKALNELGEALVSLAAGLKTVGLRGVKKAVIAIADHAGLEVEEIPEAGSSHVPATSPTVDPSAPVDVQPEAA